MAKYKLISLSVTIGGKVFRQKDNPIFDDKVFDAEVLKSAAEAGFLVLIENKKEIAEIDAKAKAEAKAKEEEEAKAKAKAEVKAKTKEEAEAKAKAEADSKAKNSNKPKQE